ncbi:hypothetical protein J41TS12_06260 [Paenibacillus antibioticophila]|uniref:Uncharacterized protein n=1 Tax=Paenibacillus antibioticophila TaxID=1274374 RepID=A0A919XSR7_9BACL|nr:hypothetical protein [Paenibacillus antibioticophila]GIO35765.1 hypothetical protein J41TS12_06260 [Paenibacillus antibioticophila]
MSVMNKIERMENSDVSKSKMEDIGQNVSSISIGDGSVVANMKKRGRKPGKKKELVFSYIPSDTQYSPQQIEEYRIKEEQLIRYIIENLLYNEAPSK